MVKHILVTGAKGFLGRNLVAHLNDQYKDDDIVLRQYDLGNTADELRAWCAEADTVFHLAGVNRPPKEEEFETGNVGFTSTLVDAIRDSGRTPHVIVSSSVQAALDNPYGNSKRRGEAILVELAKTTGCPVSIFRLKNLFGKWSRPEYNSVTATFCNNMAHDLPIQIRDPDYEITLAYVDDVCEAFIAEMTQRPLREDCMVDPDPIPSYSLTLGELAERVEAFKKIPETLLIPDFSIRFNQQLYATYLSYLPKERWEYGPTIRADQRGDLAELVKSNHFGQIFVSRTHPGITRGNHYHHTKTEKFIVVAGEAVIRFRHINETEIHEYPVRGEEYRTIEIPPGYTHSITNTGTTELITLFWASEPFDPEHPDTYFVPVDIDPHKE